VVLVKHRYNAFARSDLAERMAAAGRTQLVVAGVYAHIGVVATAMEAFQREIHPFVVADAVADFGPEEHRRALEQVASCAGVVTLADDVVAAFTRGAAPAIPDVRRGDDWDQRFRAALDGVLPGEVVEAFFARPDADWFELGLDSLRAFDFLDGLVDDGLDIDFGEFTREPTLNWLRGQARELVG
jgi:bifunctional isochorismate lyase/aryl carrier protein